MFRRIICLVSLVLVPALAGTTLGTDYYVSPSGNDGAAGTSPSTAWQTIGKVNTVTFSAGDSILFEGGETFSGQLAFDDEGGTSTSPITVGSYGTGRATLSNSTMGVEGSPTTGLGVYNNAGFEIKDLILVGPGNEGDRWDENVGLRLEADLGTAGARVDYIRIDNVDVTNYSGYGILLMGYGYSGFRDVEITNCELYGIGKEGICSKCSEWPMNQSSHNDFYIADCVMHDITGVGPRGPHSGSGINLSALDGALVEFNLAYSGGEWCMADGGGPLGIWCWETENIVFQFNEVHDWQTMGGDGGGFDLDGGTSYGTIQYCYSHDNFGGDLLMQFARSRPAHDYIYRYNINANQGQLNEMGAINFYTDKGGQPYNVEVYNNTVYVGPDAMPGSSAVDVWYWKGGSYSNINLRNNIFIAEAGKKLISYQKIAGFTFQNNLYWQSGEPLVIDGMGTIYNSLAAWRTATGQEMLDGQPVGMEIGPQLVDVHDHPVLGPRNLANLSGFKLKSTSQCRDAGLDLQTEFGIDPGTRDFWGNSIPQGSLFDISGHEYPGGGSAPAPDSTPPAAPTGLTATAAGSSIDLDWADNGESDMSHYSVKRATSSGGPYSQIISNLNASAYTDRAIVPSITYYYVVTATDTSSNQSGNSSEDSASVTYPGVLIFSDGFESGDFETGGWIATEGPTGGTADVTTEAAYTGTYGAKIGKLASIQKELSTAGYTDIRIRYMRNTINTDRRGCSIVWWDGTDLHPIEVPVGELWGLKDILC
ncbi:MAG: right-handed parallel beta-helix repeat-containing protein, partial [Planctomycetota bacterium]